MFCEKPIASTVAESRDIVSRLTDSIVPVQIGYNRRFDPACVAACGARRRAGPADHRALHDDGPRATAACLRGRVGRDLPGLQHDFDIVRWIVGREVVEVYATGTAHGEAMFAEAGDARPPRHC